MPTDPGQPAQAREDERRKRPPSEAPGMRTTRRHQHAVQKALEDGELTLDPAGGERHILSIDAEVARRSALTDSRRG